VEEIQKEKEKEGIKNWTKASVSLKKKPFALLCLALGEHRRGNSSAASAGKTRDVFPFRLRVAAGLFALIFFFQEERGKLKSSFF